MSHYIINNEKIIPFDKKYELCMLEDRNTKIMSPISDYFLKLNDQSINLLISLKWILWGYFFLNSLSNFLKNNDQAKFEDLIQKSINSPIKNLVKKGHIILIDDVQITDEVGLHQLINEFYSEAIFDANTIIHMKLKLNLDEFLFISYEMFPALMKYHDHYS